MSGNIFLDWAGIAVSLFNTIVLIWLGLTVILNSQRRTTGIWIIASQLLLAGVFFLSHTVILSQPLISSGSDLNFWWQLTWLPVVVLPYAWYAVMLWYSGFWDTRDSRLYHRHLYLLVLASGLAILIAGMLYLANPIPSIAQLLNLDFNEYLSISGVPLMILVYPIYIGACIALSADALRYPAPSARMMGDLARQRARPWLLSASIVLLVVGLLVGGVMVWVFTEPGAGLIHPSFAHTVVVIDLMIASLIAAAIWLVGQAIVSYEVFTGHTLPRRGLRHHWSRLLILAAGFSVVVSGGLIFQLSGIYLLLLSALLIATFYALLSWRSFIEREEFLSHLRPFVRSQRLLDQLLSPTDVGLAENDLQASFESFCSELLRAKKAVLIPAGTLSMGLVKPQFYPEDYSPVLADMSEIVSQIPSPSTLSVSIDPALWEGMVWALPLWSDRGLIGILLLGEKIDGGLYTQEEFEIAQTACERLLDTQASLELSRRLFAFQRQRLAQDRLLDHQTRRILHDDILPLLHTAMLRLDQTRQDNHEASDEAIQTLARVHREIAALIREMPRAQAPELAKLGFTEALQQMVEFELPGAQDQVNWQVDPEAEQKVRAIPEWALEVVFYAAREAIRNASRHAARDHSGGSRPIDICLNWNQGLEIQVRNKKAGSEKPEDGGGGSGQGLVLHSTMMAVIGGTFSVERMPDHSVQATIHLPEGSFRDLETPL